MRKNPYRTEANELMAVSEFIPELDVEENTSSRILDAGPDADPETDEFEPVIGDGVGDELEPVIGDGVGGELEPEFDELSEEATARLVVGKPSVFPTVSDAANEIYEEFSDLIDDTPEQTKQLKNYLVLLSREMKKIADRI